MTSAMPCGGAASAALAARCNVVGKNQLTSTASAAERNVPNR